MKSKISILSILFMCAISIFVGCNSHVSDRDMKLAYSLLNENPDSAVRLLAPIQRDQLGFADKAYCSLLYTIALDKSGPDVDNDSLIRTAFDYYRSRTLDSLYAKCMLYMGKYYVQNDSIMQGLQCLELAVKSAERECDLYTQYLALDKISMTIRVSDPLKAVVMEKRAYELFCKYDSTNLYNRVSLLKNIGNCFVILNEKDSIVHYMEKALDLARQAQNSQLLTNTYHSMSVAYQKAGMPDSAFIYIKRAISTEAHVQNSAYLQLASCFMDLDSLDQAESVLHNISYADNSRMKYSVYRKLLEIELARQGSNKASLYVDSTLNSLMQIYKETEKDNYNFVQNNLSLKTSLEESKKEKMLIQVIYLFTFLFAAIAIAFISYLHYNRKKAALQESQLRIKELSMSNALIQAEKEKQELILDNRERQVEIMRKYIIRMKDIETTIKNIKDKSLFDKLSDETWLEITAFLNETESNFVDVLSSRYPDLTSRDIRFLMLVKLGFTNQELEKLCLRSPQAIKQRLLNYKAKLRIDKKDISTREFILRHFWE